jgi:methionyl-tRNA formyltransferase
MKILAIGYRDWAINIYKNLSKKKIKIKIVKKEVNLKNIKNYNPDFILFYGWSKKVSKKIVEEYKCIMLHPSKLPQYAGGSPIQNQIIRNVKTSAVTLFRMSEKIDHGNIILQKKLLLTGDLNEIFKRIVDIGTFLTLKMLKNKYKDKKIKIKKIYSRKMPKDSEITLNDLKVKDANFLYNKIRMLQDPYPNAYIKTIDGKKLYLLKAILKK